MAIRRYEPAQPARVSLVYKPSTDNTLSILATRATSRRRPNRSRAPTNLAVYDNTTQQPSIPLSSRSARASELRRCRRDQKLTRKVEVGVDAYYKRARNLLDDGQFGQALVLTAFNYDRAYNTGVEFKSVYQSGEFRAYGNLAWGRQRATQVVSNQFLFGSTTSTISLATTSTRTTRRRGPARRARHTVPLRNTRLSRHDLRQRPAFGDFANTTHVSPYTQVNLGLSREIPTPSGKPVTLRLDVVNLFDHSYELRDGSGIGVFAPQYGPRRGFFAGLKQAF